MLICLKITPAVGFMDKADPDESCLLGSATELMFRVGHWVNLTL